MESVKLGSIVLLLIFCILMLNQQSESAEVNTLEVEVRLSPAAYFTLISPYNGSIRYLAKAGETVSPIPTEIPPNGLSADPWIHRELLHSYMSISRKVALAWIVENRSAQDDYMSKRNSELFEIFQIYGLKASSSNIPPWEDHELTPAESWIAKKFYESFLGDDLWRVETSNMFRKAEESLIFEKNNGEFDAVTSEIMQRIKKDITFEATEAEFANATEQALLFLARGNRFAYYSVYPKPDTGDPFEPNNVELISDEGKIKIITPRTGRVDGAPVDTDPSLWAFCTYWEKVDSGYLKNSNDAKFLSKIVLNQRLFREKNGLPDIPPENEDRPYEVLVEIHAECKGAINEIYRGSKLGTVVNIVSRLPYSRDVDENIRLILRESNFWAKGVTFPESVIKDVARSFAIVAPYPPNPQKPYEFRRPRPSASSAARIVNELRPSMKYKGKYLDVSERAGYLKLLPDDQWYETNYRLWTITLPLGGDGDNGDFFRLASGKSWLPAEQRFPDLERIFDIEMSSGIELSPAFFSVSAVESFDTIAAAIRQLDYSKIDAGRRIRIVAEELRGDLEVRNTLIKERDKRIQQGFFFVPEDSLVIKVMRQENDSVEPGDPIALVKPIHKHYISFETDSVSVLKNIHPGIDLNAELICDNYFPNSLDAKKYPALKDDLRRIGDDYLKGKNVSITIDNIALSSLSMGDKKTIHATINIPPELRRIPISINDAENLAALKDSITTDADGKWIFTPPQGILFDYALCKIKLPM